MESLKDATTSMIGVYGMAGVGKTWLVKEVERQLHEVKLFNSVVRATASRIPDIKEIQDQIAYSLGLKLEENSPVVRARKLYGRLRNEKNVLIILDDLWKKLDLKEVGIPFGSQHKGCKILLTSRSRNVVSNEMGATKTFAVDDLDEEEAWEFFKKMAGNSVESDEELRSTAIEVVKKCARLPLALATVARALRNESLFGWRDALQQLQRPCLEHSSSEISAEVHSNIKLSINHLSSEDLKQIFLLCSLLRRDTRIEDLLRYARGLGLIKGVNSMKAERDRLLKMMRTLKESCLLRDSKSTNEEYFDVHDLTYSLAKSIASNDNQVLALTEVDKDEDEDVVAGWPNGESMKECNKIILRDPSINKLPDQLNCPQLFLFLLFSKDLSLTLPDNFFKEAKNLVLGLTCMHFSSLPSSIGLLTSLSTLCLDHCNLGDNLTIIGALKNLNVLSLAGSDIKIVPKEIGQLLKLKLLDVSGCTKLKTISANVLPSLSKLEELYMGGTCIQWGQPNASLAELNTLSHLSTLEVEIPDAKAAPEDFFQKLQKLERYKICIGKEWVRFRNYQYSRTLKLRLNTSIDDFDHGIKKLVKRTLDLQLDKLKGVKINALEEVTDEERLSHLQNLHIQNGLDIESIINARNEFPHLQSLTLEGLPQLVSFCCQDKIDGTSLPQRALPLFGEKINGGVHSFNPQLVW
ncbi:disease resistance protein At4g27190-like [Gossypium hirsutum]|uniref:Disease resistance protein At4g27190-like n=1 Tax=Gossypium hirsutum TaxID=3635 RepID=A0ABM2Z5S7_GOSHI|nr:disease resistance protein At4g27190-like [Gossypium hirsutum]